MAACPFECGRRLGKGEGRTEAWLSLLGSLSPFPFPLPLPLIVPPIFSPFLLSQVVPGQIVAVVAGTALVAALAPLGLAEGIDTIGSRFGAGAIPSTLPEFHLPSAPGGWSDVERLLPPAFTIALLAAIESLLCAEVADGMIDDRHDPNTELVAQGIANMASATAGGLPATGALARTAASVRAGGRSPIAGCVHALVVAVIMLSLGGWRSTCRCRCWRPS